MTRDVPQIKLSIPSTTLADARVLYQVTSCGICGGQSDHGSVFYSVFALHDMNA
jgi:hypothetical protein